MTEPDVGTGRGRPLVLVLVGTDHHPFDRLIDWIERWLADGAAARVECVVQHGTSRVPLGAAAQAYFDHHELERLMRRASVVVSHGGPSTIAESRRLGQLPLVVPRDSAHGEHVDDHQKLFCTRLAEAGLIASAEDESGLRTLLDRALEDPSTVSVVVSDAGEVSQAVRRFGELVDGLLGDRRDGSAQRPRLLYVGGFGRSGSTLLERILGQVPGVAASGEIVHLWRRGVAGDERCGCGEPFGQCEFWIAVGKAAYGGWDRVDIETVLSLCDLVDRTRTIPALVAPWTRPSFRRRMRSLLHVLNTTYAAIAQVSGAELVVDSSKHASYAFLLRRSRVDLRVVHVVRDSCGVGYSWSKLVLKPEVVDRESFMPVFSPLQTSLYWSVNNLAFHVLAHLGVPVLRVRYEDLLRSPVETVESILRFANRPAVGADLAFLAVDHVELGRDHTVAGNPMRFRTGRVDIRLDEEWRTRMPRGDRRLVSLATLPLRLRYGYLLGRGRR